MGFFLHRILKQPTWADQTMAAIGEFIRPKLPGNIEFSGDSSAELHVLAVDDSLVDRKVIERLLKNSSCKGIKVLHGFTYLFVFLIGSIFFSFLFSIFLLKFDWPLLFIYYYFVVTAVESGARALQYLGLDGEKNSVGINVSNLVITFFYFFFLFNLFWIRKNIQALDL